MKSTAVVLVLVALVTCAFAASCSKEAEGPKPAQSPKRIKVQHILVAFKGTGTAATRSKEEAEKLAADLLAQAEDGADFTALMKANSDDPGPGVYAMVAVGPKQPGEFLRSEMVPAFGDVGWRLEAGEIGVAPYDPAKSPFGWHIIKRLE